MGRVVILALMLLAVLVVVIWGMTLFARAMLRRQRQKELAQYAPQLLSHHGVPGAVEALVIDQQRAIDKASDIMSAILADDVAILPTEYADPVQAWLVKNDRKRIGT